MTDNYNTKMSIPTMTINVSNYGEKANKSTNEPEDAGLDTSLNMTMT